MPSLDASSVSRPAHDRRPPLASADELGAIYEEHFDFVWRSLRRLGVPVSACDDASQEVFVVVFRRLAEFEARSSLRTWLFSIALNIARHYRRALRSNKEQALDESLVHASDAAPEEQARLAEAMRIVYSLLDTLEDSRREVFVLAHLEQMPAADIADALGIPLNTVYSRLRLARRDFDAALRRHHARDGR